MGSPPMCVGRPHTHTLESKKKEKQHSRMQENRSNAENFAPEERKQSKNHCSPVKLESKKQAKKVITEREGLGWEVPIDRLGPSRAPSITRHI